ncbi:MAG: signal recognition particle-docking protein FtsY [Spirochaetes bacterium]|nr:MAG: signal recognition particle-docking protein FtsY [Spirochaetota bacterium]
MFGRRKKQNTGEARSSVSPKNFGRRIKELLSRGVGSGEAFYEELEDLLVEADFGASAAVDLADELREHRRNKSGGLTRDELIEELKNLIRPSLNVSDLTPDPEKLTLYLVLGVNGVGKTTTIAKMAHRFAQSGSDKIVLAAGDTFRAAAIDQLEIHGRRVGARVVKQEHGSDPGAVIYDAINSALSRGDTLIIADTAGRMHNRTNLVKELSKIDRIIKERIGQSGVYRKLLVIDATTGQNGMRQAETFHESIGVDAVVMTKYDSTAKGGLVAAISRKLSLPFAFMGRGEGMDDLEPFNPDIYLDELLAGD